MRCMMILKSTPEIEAGAPPNVETMTAVGNLIEEMVAAGVFLGGEGLYPSSQGKRVRYRDGRVTEVIDGPFAEAKELIAGYVVIDVPTWDEALEWTRKFATIEQNGESELRILHEAADFADAGFTPEQIAREQALRDELQRKATVR
jgi:hypothetical protein